MGKETRGQDLTRRRGDTEQNAEKAKRNVPSASASVPPRLRVGFSMFAGKFPERRPSCVCPLCVSASLRWKAGLSIYGRHRVGQTSSAITPEYPLETSR